MSPTRTTGPAIALAGLLVALLGPTAHAGGTTRWVDDDGRAGPSRCDSTARTFKKVQPAIMASAPGDTVIVCPGTYVGEVVISTPARDGLTLRGAMPGTARLRPGSELSKAGAMTVFQADGVTIRDLVIQVPTAPPCRRIHVAVWITESTGASLRRVGIEPLGTNTIGPCGYDTGVLVTDASATMLGSTIRDFRLNGVFAPGQVGGPYPDITVKRSRILYLHASEAPDVERDSETVGLYGIRSDVTRFRRNTVGSATTGGKTTPLLGSGIIAYSVVSPAVVNNTVTTTTWGISITAITGDVSKNTVTIGRRSGTDPSRGLLLGGGDGVAVTENEVHRFAIGIFVDGGAQNHSISMNDFRDNKVLDCSDDTTGGFGTDGTSNFWTLNQGDPDSPSGICDP